jgi:hypothetical protein
VSEQLDTFNDGRLRVYPIENGERRILTVHVTDLGVNEFTIDEGEGTQPSVRGDVDHARFALEVEHLQYSAQGNTIQVARLPERQITRCNQAIGRWLCLLGDGRQVVFREKVGNWFKFRIRLDRRVRKVIEGKWSQRLVWIYKLGRIERNNFGNGGLDIKDRATAEAGSVQVQSR